MSFFFDTFVDPFFDTFAPYHHRVDDFFRPTYYLRSIHPTEEEEEEEYKDEEEKSVVPKKTENKSLIHPYTGFGRLDVKEQDKQYIVSVDLPGVEKEDIHLDCNDEHLTIECERKNEVKEEDKKTNYCYIERSFGSFQRSIKLPDNIDIDNINAEYTNGVLHVTLPKIVLPAKESKKISVN